MTITPKPRSPQPDLDRILPSLPEDVQRRVEAARRKGELVAALEEAAWCLKEDTGSERAPADSMYCIDIGWDFYPADANGPMRVESYCNVGTKPGLTVHILPDNSIQEVYEVSELPKVPPGQR